jgi:hypothetical protein
MPRFASRLSRFFYHCSDVWLIKLSSICTILNRNGHRHCHIIFVIHCWVPPSQMSDWKPSKALPQPFMTMQLESDELEQLAGMLTTRSLGSR